MTEEEQKWREETINMINRLGGIDIFNSISNLFLQDRLAVIEDRLLEQLKQVRAKLSEGDQFRTGSEGRDEQSLALLR